MPSLLEQLQPPGAVVTALDPDDEIVAALLKDLPGNILKGHGRVFTKIRFLRFVNPTQGRAWVGDIGSALTTAEELLHQAEGWRALRAFPLEAAEVEQGERDFFRGLYLTAQGMKMLGCFNPVGAEVESFESGLLTPEHHVAGGKASQLGDEEEDWRDDGYKQELHAALVVAYTTQAQEAKAKKYLEESLTRAEVETSSATQGATPHENGGRLYDAGGWQGGREVEHFGFRDGISTLNFLTRKYGEAPTGDIFPLSQVLVSLRKITGLQRHENTYGSFLVFRKLEQDVPGFEQAIRKYAEQELGAGRDEDLELARALIVGRFRDGTPISHYDKPAGAPMNDFDFTQVGDAGQMGGKVCPFHAHIRKMNPRGDHDPAQAVPPRDRLPVRRSVPYGIREMKGAGRVLDVGRPPAKDEKVGLLFMAFMSDIKQCFEHLTIDWANASAFPWPGTDADPLVGRTGIENVRVTGARSKMPFYFPHCVTARGGAYLFAPPRSFFAEIKSGAIP